MRKLIALAFFACIGLAGASSSQAMTPALLDNAQVGMTIQIAGGCGAGFHRGPYGGCRPNGGGGAVVVAPGAVVVAPVGRCGGRGTHRVCNPQRCWQACN